MRILYNVISEIEKCLDGTDFIKERGARIDKLKKGSTYQPPESILYWNKFGAEIIEDIGTEAENSLDPRFIKALSVWGDTTEEEILKIVNNRRNIRGL